MFQRTVSIVRRQSGGSHWWDMRYLVFDLPTHPGPFEERIKALRDVMRGSGPYAQQLAHIRCRGVAHMQQELARVNAAGGEGLMLRQPASRYEAGRSHTLLKVKTFHDAEAQVVAHQPGAGRHKGRLGALLCALPDGTEFCVGTGFSDRQRESPPPVGSTITFRYQELTDRGVPRFPSFVRVRADA
jgi:DNA ligase-1